MLRPNEPNSRRLPADPMETKTMWDYYRIVRGPDHLRQVVDTDYSQSLITVFLKEANFRTRRSSWPTSALTNASTSRRSA